MFVRPFDRDRREAKRPSEVELTPTEFGRRVIAVSDMEVVEPYGAGMTKVTYFRGSETLGVMIKQGGRPIKLLKVLELAFFGNSSLMTG